jgi:hypothetical protein
MAVKKHNSLRQPALDDVKDHGIAGDIRCTGPVPIKRTIPTP